MKNESNNNIETNEAVQKDGLSQGGLQKNFSIQEKLEKVNQEIETFNYKARSPEEKAEIEKIRESEYLLKKWELEKKLGPLSEGSDYIIRKKMLADAMELASLDNERFDHLKLEKQNLLNLEIAEDFISSLKEFGIHPPQEEKANLLDALTSPRLVDCDRSELIRLLGINLQDQEQLKNLSINVELNSKFQRILRGQLVSFEYRELLLAHDVDLADREEFERSGANKMANYEGQEINDAEVVGLGVENVKQMVKDILNDDESSAGQGMFWNVLVSKKIPYVLKAERKMEDRRKVEYRERALFYYPVIRDAIGKRFLPKQAILKSESAKRFFVLQERQDLDKMIKVKTSTIEKIEQGEYGAEIIEALKEEKNKQELRDFIAGAEKLLRQNKLMIDMEGDNLFFQVSEGNLEIKLVDYGCFESKWDGRPDDIVRGEKLLERLKKLC